MLLYNTVVCNALHCLNSDDMRLSPKIRLYLPGMGHWDTAVRQRSAKRPQILVSRHPDIVTYRRTYIHTYIHTIVHTYIHIY